MGEQVALKRYRRIDDWRVELRAESTNAAHRPQVVDADTGQLHVEGVMVAALVGAAAAMPFFD